MARSVIAMATENTNTSGEATRLPEESRAGSEAHLDEWVAPDIADERGFLRAGKILEWMDVVGVLAASRHCRRPVATASVDGMELLHPIRVGERVTMTASVGYTSARSLGVSVSMRHGTPAAEQRSLTGYMTFVALDPRGKPGPVPQLRPQTPAEVARFREGNLRREFRSKLRSGQLPAPPAPTGREQALFVRELLKLLPRSLLPIGRGDALEPRRRHVSYVHKIEPVRASRLNFNGTLYGGTLMKWIETTANLSARAYLDGVPVRLGGLHGLGDAAPKVFEQQTLWHDAVKPDETALELLGKLVQDVREQASNSDSYDGPMLTRLTKWGGLLDTQIRTVILPTIGAYSSRSLLDQSVVAGAKALSSRIPVERQVRVVGTIDMVRYSTRSMGLRLDDGNEVRCAVVNEELSELREYLNKEVTVLGKAVYRPSGSVLRLDVEQIHPESQKKKTR